jgi:hypothetical protein
MQRHIAKRVKRNPYFLVRLRWQTLRIEASANIMVSSWHFYLSQLCDTYVCCWPIPISNALNRQIATYT